MEHSSSVDDLVGTFWDESGATLDAAKAAAAMVNRSSSEWSFQEFLKDDPTAPAGSLKLRPACKSRFLAESERAPGDSEAPCLRAAELQLYPCTDAPPDPSAAVEGALHPLFSGLRDESSKLSGVAVADPGVAASYPQEYEWFLKHKLEMACAAVAVTRVWPRNSSFLQLKLLSL